MKLYTFGIDEQQMCRKNIMPFDNILGWWNGWSHGKHKGGAFESRDR